MSLFPLFLLVLFCAILLLSAYKNAGFAFLFIFLFFVIFDILMARSGLEHGKLLFRYTIMSLMLFFNRKYISVQFTILKKNEIFWGFLLLSLPIFCHFVFPFKVPRPDPMYLLDYLAYIFFPFFIPSLIFHSTKEFDSFPRDIVFLGLIFCIVFYIYGNFDVIQIFDRSSLKDTGFVGSIFVSRLSGIMFVCGLLLALLEKEYKLKAIYLVCIAFSTYLLIIAKQRGILIGIPFALTGFFLHVKAEKDKLIIILLLLSIGLSTAFGLKQLLYEADVVKRFAALREYYTMPRYYDYFISLDLFRDNFLFGLGPEGYLYNTGREYPHNFVLEAMVEYGVLGLLSASLIIIGGFRHVFLIWRSKDISYATKIVPVLWVLLLFSVMVSGNITRNAMFFVLTGTLVAISTSSSYRRMKKANL